VHRRTVRQALQGAVPQERRKPPQRRSVLEPAYGWIDEMLRADLTAPRKQKHTIVRIHQRLIIEYDFRLASVRTVGNYVSQRRPQIIAEVREGRMHMEGMVPQLHLPGEEAEVDFCDVWVRIAGQTTQCHLFTLRLSFSGKAVHRVFVSEAQEAFMEGHVEAFRVLGGVPRRGIFDNMKTAVDRIRTGKARQVNARFAALASHYLFEPEFCNPASGWEKGQVEKNVQDARRRLWQPLPSFPDLDALNAWLEQRCIEQWGEIQHGVLPGTVADVLGNEITSLMRLGRPFDGFVEHSKRVSPTCLVHFERNRYSVPASFANRPVSMRVYPGRIVIAAEGQILCEHARIINRSHHLPGQTIYDWRHYLAVIQRKPGALRNGAPFAEMPEGFRRLQGHLLKRAGGDREMVEILALVLQHDEQAVLCAVELALEAGVPTKTHILNILHRLIDGKADKVARIDAPQALSLQREPEHNVERYDALRGKDLRHAS